MPAVVQQPAYTAWPSYVQEAKCEALRMLRNKHPMALFSGPEALQAHRPAHGFQPVLDRLVVDQRVEEITHRRVHGHAGRLVDRDHPLVLVDEGQVDRHRVGECSGHPRNAGRQRLFGMGRRRAGYLRVRGGT